MDGMVECGLWSGLVARIVRTVHPDPGREPPQPPFPDDTAA
jgi:hypothetical protein